MKPTVLILFFVLIANVAFADHECESTCSDYCRSVIANYETVVKANRELCGDGGNCISRLARIRTSWDTGLRTACKEAGADCVIYLAERYEDWNPNSLQVACRNDYDNCAGRLADLKPGWNATALNGACKDAVASCVLSLAESRPEWSSSSLNRACR